MPTKTRIIIVSVLILLGGVLFSYCLFLYPIDITTQVKGSLTTVTGSEQAPVNQTSIDGAEPDKSTQTKKSRSKSPPRAGAI